MTPSSRPVSASTISAAANLGTLGVATWRLNSAFLAVASNTSTRSAIPARKTWPSSFFFYIPSKSGFYIKYRGNVGRTENHGNTTAIHLLAHSTKTSLLTAAVRRARHAPAQRPAGSLECNNELTRVIHFVFPAALAALESGGGGA